MSATTALDGLGAVEGTRGLAARSRSGSPAAVPDAAGHAEAGPRVARVSALGLAARPRGSTPVFVDGGRRARWVGRLGGLAGVALGVWLASVGLALMGLGTTAGPDVRTERAVLHTPTPVGPPTGVSAGAAASDGSVRGDGVAGESVGPLFAAGSGPAEPATYDRPPGGAEAVPATTTGLPPLLAPTTPVDDPEPTDQASTSEAPEVAAPVRPGADEGRDALDR